MATEGLSTTRRAILSGALALPAVALVCTPAISSTTLVDRTAWDRAFAAYERAKAASDAYDVEFWTIHSAYDDACEAVPHVTLRPDPYSGVHRPVTTEKKMDVADARRRLRSVVRWDDQPDINEHMTLCAELVAAADTRDAEINRIAVQLGYTAANDRYDKLVDAQADAESVLIKLPAPDAPALMWKLDQLMGEDSRSGADRSGAAWCAPWLDAVMADARHLLVREA